MEGGNVLVQRTSRHDGPCTHGVGTACRPGLLVRGMVFTTRPGDWSGSAQSGEAETVQPQQDRDRKIAGRWFAASQGSDKGLGTEVQSFIFKHDIWEVPAITSRPAHEQNRGSLGQKMGPVR